MYRDTVERGVQLISVYGSEVRPIILAFTWTHGVDQRGKGDVMKICNSAYHSETEAYTIEHAPCTGGMCSGTLSRFSRRGG